jgi:peptidoglycan/LPS O-acetylase OafA/YrhL
VGALLFFLVCLYFSKYLPISFRYSIYYWPAIVLLLLAFSIQVGFLSRILSAKLFVVLGESSFSLYMIHTLVQSYFTYFAKTFRDKNIGLGGYLLLTLLCIVLAFLSFRFFEMPMNKWVKKILKNEK